MKKIIKTAQCLCLVTVLLWIHAPLHGKNCSKAVAEVFNFLVSNYQGEQIANAVKSSYGQHQGEDVFVGNLKKFLPKTAYVKHQSICTPCNCPDHGKNGETIYSVCIKFTYLGKDLAYKFTAVQTSPVAPTILKEVFLFGKENGSYEKIVDLSNSFSD